MRVAEADASSIDRNSSLKTLVVAGGGLAGSEAAWAQAKRRVRVTLNEMRPAVSTRAHQTGRLAELVRSNSFN